MEGLLISEILYPSTISAMSDFHERLDIPLDIEEARKRFVNRVCNHIFDTWDLLYKALPRLAFNIEFRSIISELGIRYNKNLKSIYNCINTDNYFEVLHGIEVIYKHSTYFNMKSIINKNMKNYNYSCIRIGSRCSMGKRKIH